MAKERGGTTTERGRRARRVREEKDAIHSQLSSFFLPFYILQKNPKAINTSGEFSLSLPYGSHLG